MNMGWIGKRSIRIAGLVKKFCSPSFESLSLVRRRPASRAIGSREPREGGTAIDLAQRQSFPDKLRSERAECEMGHMAIAATAENSRTRRAR